MQSCQSMRITNELLQIHSSQPIDEVEYLDLSRKDIVIIEKLSICRGLRTLILSGNFIKGIQNVDCCRQLWNLDLSGNRLKSLCGLSRFPVLGSVCLGFNELEWQELHRINHITILSLSLVGNLNLDSDPNYRHHVIDMLPNVWMLDGRLITAKERKKVEDFFVESQSSSHPVRRKTLGKVFVPTSLKNLLVSGVFGEKTVHMMSRFPVNYIHNVDMDKKRLSYLVYSIEDDMRLAQLHRSALATPGPLEQPNEDYVLRKANQTPNIHSLFQRREKELEQCNMLLLLMLAALEYSIPLEVLQATLETAKLATVGGIYCMDLFVLPNNMILDIASLLLSAATVDRLEGKEGGLYSQLYRSLCTTMDSVQRKIKCSPRKSGSFPKRHGDSKKNAWHCLLASEVVHLMCLVPQFFDSILNNQGLAKIITVATKNSDALEMIANITSKVKSRGGGMWDVYQDIASYLLQATSDNVSARRKRQPPAIPNLYKTTSQLLHPTQPKVSPRLFRAKSAGMTTKMTTKRSSVYTSRTVKEPEPGDLVIIGAEQVARIIALLESRTAVLQVGTSSALSSEHADYIYADTNGLSWDNQFKYWTKDPWAGDFSSSHLSDSLSCATLPALASASSLNESPVGSRAATPEHVSRPASRPLSGISFRSDDLKTIPSEEELIEEVQGERSPSIGSSPRGQEPTRVDFNAPSMTSVTSESDHKNHVLHQYSVNQLRTNEPKTPLHEYDILVSPRSQALKDLQKSTKEAKDSIESNGITVPSPQLQFAEMWESDKSVPTVSSSHPLKTHSCRVIELDKQNLRVEPHMPPPAVLSTEVHRSASPLRTQSPALMHHPDEDVKHYTSSLNTPVMYNAWTVALPDTPNKHSTLTSKRLMQKRQPKQPPVAQTNEIHSTGPGSYSVPRSKPLQQVQQRMDVHNPYIGKKYHYHHPKARLHGGGCVRKLGTTGFL